MVQGQQDVPSAEPSSWRSRALKWVAAITAVISLILGVRQLTSWISGTVNRKREAATLVELGKEQASRGGFADAWKSLERAQDLNPDDAVEAARVDVAFAWLEEAHPATGQPFSSITDVVTPVLDRALLKRQGPRRADVLAHLGWVTFLRSRDGVMGDPDARYQEALSVDPGNVFANTFLGHWLMWTGAQVEAARERFDRALAQAGPKRPFVRRFQLAALTNRGEAGDAELLRVAGEMRQQEEPLSPAVAGDVYWLYTMKYGPNAGGSDRARSGSVRADAGDGAAADLATYDWVVATPGFPDRSPEMRGYVRGVLQEGAGQREAALATFRGLQQQRAALPSTLRDRVRSAVDRLAR